MEKYFRNCTFPSFMKRVTGQSSPLPQCENFSSSLSLKRALLAPVIQFTLSQEAAILSDKINEIGEQQFIDELDHHGLAPLWYDFLVNAQLSNNFSSCFTNDLKRQKTASVASVLLQENIQQQIHDLFGTGNIPYLVYKGCNLRYSIYADPALRPAADIDILILEKDRQQAINTLLLAGFQLNINPVNVSHEVNLNKNSTSIDLHWGVVRPGRTRIDLSSCLFENRTRLGPSWGLNHQANLVVMLIHPVFSKQLNSPSSLLIHIVDLYQLLQQENINWENIINILDSLGAKTAAWCSLYWLKELTGYCVPDTIYLKIKPGHLHEYYLRFWIDKNLINRLWHHRWFVKLMFDLALHDTIKDAIRAIIMLSKEKMLAFNKVKKLITQPDTCNS